MAIADASLRFDEFQRRYAVRRQGVAAGRGGAALAGALLAAAPTSRGSCGTTADSSRAPGSSDGPTLRRVEWPSGRVVRRVDLPAGRVPAGDSPAWGSVCGRRSPAQLRGQTALPARPGAGQRGRARRRAMRPAKPRPRRTSAEGAGTAATSRWMARASRLFAEAPTSVTPAVAGLIVTRWLSPFRSMLTPKRTPALLKSAAPMTMEAPSPRAAPESAATRVWLPSAALVQPPLPAQAGRRYGCPGPRYGSSSGRRAGRGDGERGKWAEKRAQHL